MRCHLDAGIQGMAPSRERAKSPPAKRLRPSSTEDVILQKAERAASKRKGGGGGSSGGALTVSDISADRLMKTAQQNWAPALNLADAGKSKGAAAAGAKAKPAFSPDLVTRIYNTELGGASSKPPALRRIMLLEISQYLENYLWPHFDPEAASFEHVMSIILMVNEKFRESIPAWTCFHTRAEVFPSFLQRVLALKQQGGRPVRTHELIAFLLFSIHIFESLENEMVRTQVLKLVSIPLWHALSKGRLQLELHAQPQLAKHWKNLAKKEVKAAAKAGHVPIKQRPEATFIPGLVEEFLEVRLGLLSSAHQLLANSGSCP